MHLFGEVSNIHEKCSNFLIYLTNSNFSHNITLLIITLFCKYYLIVYRQTFLWCLAACAHKHNSLCGCLNFSPCRLSSCEVSSPVDSSSHECWSEDDESNTSTQEEMRLSALSARTDRESGASLSLFARSSASSSRQVFLSDSLPRFNML